MNRNCTALIAALGLALASCSGGDDPSAPSGTGSVDLLVTDDPFAHELVVDARIWVDEVRIHGESSGFLRLYAGAPIEIDLLHLRNGATQLLVHSDVPAGHYDQIRLVVSRAYLRLVDGDEFASDLGNLHLTSLDTSGLKLFVAPPLEVLDGVARSVLLDFDLTKTFKAVPGNDVLGASFYQLHPVVHVVNLSDTGEIRGVVEESDGAGGFTGVADATVYVLMPGALDLSQAVLTTATELDGSYAALGVMPGTYDVVAAEGGRQARSDDHRVFAGSVTTVDLILP